MREEAKMKCYKCDIAMVQIHSDGTHQCPVCGLIQSDRQLELELRELQEQETEAGGDIPPIWTIPAYTD